MPDFVPPSPDYAEPLRCLIAEQETQLQYERRARLIAETRLTAARQELATQSFLIGKIKGRIAQLRSLLIDRLWEKLGIEIDQLELSLGETAAPLNEATEAPGVSLGIRHAAPLLDTDLLELGGMVNQQLAEIRVYIAQECERIFAGIHVAFEETNIEIKGIIGKASEGFRTTALELGQISREWQSELAATREALRISAADLPQETAQQAPAMRIMRDIKPKGVGARPQQAGQPLDAISLDVASMIDPDAAAEAWERYRRGEANAFSRRIYLGRGAQTFDEVRRRYRLDPEFHATIDRYVQEFERLLAELNRDNADESATQTYLNSETGMVYTMLAHASGRLG
ncbi:hypothetical protein MPC4_100002 [Methylocella tundrae]|uniref:Uncharacterized protein n=1 Tax=Methylocella tundrae TaxID=227605 RepID=A0A8B6M254_METTU|nr:hypothetical protein [Methylocella tundrae]VTZ48559.1 hypothetical protein MPC4_100002 [Methylocella tundrae]